MTFAQHGDILREVLLFHMFVRRVDMKVAVLLLRTIKFVAMSFVLRAAIVAEALRLHTT